MKRNASGEGENKARYKIEMEKSTMIEIEKDGRKCRKTERTNEQKKTRQKQKESEREREIVDQISNQTDTAI